MGRYYGTAHYDGKFGFGVQSSYDPVDVFGMWDESNEDDECEANFYLEATDAALSHIKAEIDKQYDLLEIPASRRIYEVEDNMTIWNLFDEFEDKLYRPFEKGVDKCVPYYSKKYDEGIVEIRPGIQLAKCRVDLGTKIYSELLKDGKCWMWAEV